MRRVLSIFLVCFALTATSCASIGLEKHWGAVRRSYIEPALSGKCLYAEQDIYGLLAPNGEVVWSKEIKDSRRVTLKRFDNFYYVIGDSNHIIRVDLKGNAIWEYKAPSGTSIYPLASSSEFLIAAFDQDASYPLNNIDLLAFKTNDGSEAWRLSDRDYQPLLMLPAQDFLSEVILAPYSRGTTVWVDGLSVVDGKQLWRSIQSLPRSGHPLVLAQTESKIWLWQAKNDGVEACVIRRSDGLTIGKSFGPSFSMADYSFVRDQVFIFFKDKTFKIDSLGKYSEFKSDWMPISGIPSVLGKYVAIERNCERFGIMDAVTLKVDEGFKLQVCYYGVPGLSPGEFYLVPEVAPYDHQTFKLTYLSEKEAQSSDALDSFKRLGKDKSLFDLADKLRKLKP